MSQQTKRLEEIRKRALNALTFKYSKDSETNTHITVRDFASNKIDIVIENVEYFSYSQIAHLAENGLVFDSIHPSIDEKMHMYVKDAYAIIKEQVK